ncbi:MAG: hydrogenase maturation protease, partial [Anaerolineae bacterium]
MKTLVLGLGNPILTDDGVGIEVVRALKPRVDDAQVTLYESSRGGLNLLDTLAGYDRAIIVDAIQTRGGKVGDVYRLRADDFGPCLHVSCAHDVDFATALELGRKIGLRLPKDITIVAVEVQDVTTFGEECTPVVQVAISTAVDMVLQGLESAGCAGWQDSPLRAGRRCRP